MSILIVAAIGLAIVLLVVLAVGLMRSAARADAHLDHLAHSTPLADEVENFLRERARTSGD